MLKFESHWPKPIKIVCAGDRLAIAALVIYTIGELVFRYSQVNETLPAIAALTPLSAMESISIALAISAIATRPRRMSAWQCTLAAISLALLFFSATKTGDYRIAQTFILMVALGGVDWKRLCGAYSATIIAVVAVIMLLAVTGFVYCKDVIPNGRLVFSYGFSHPNGLGAYLFTALGALAYLCWNRGSWWIPLVLAVSSAVFSYAMLSSYTTVVVLTLLSLTIIVGHVPPFRGITGMPRRAFLIVLICVPLVVLLVMLFCTAAFSSEVPAFSVLDNLLHARPRHAHGYFVDHGGFTLFGRKFVNASSYHSGVPFANVDSGYCLAALSTGIAPLLALAATYAIAVFKLAKDNPHPLIFVLLLIGSLHLALEAHQLFIATGSMAIWCSYAFSGGGPEGFGGDDNRS